MKRDPYKHKERWESWKTKACQNGISRVSSTNSKIILQYLLDMEMGLNVASVSSKGPRSPIRLNTLREKLVFLARHFENRFYLDDLTKLTEEQLLSLFADLNNGLIKNRSGKKYLSIVTYSKIIKAFWHWHQKRSKKQGVVVLDVTADLDSFYEKPKWVYLNEHQVWKVINSAKYDYRALFTFQLDSGIRSPTELINVKVSDLYKQCKEVEIRHETAKRGSFGRRIKLMLSSELLQEHIKRNQLGPDDYLFDIVPQSVNKYLKRLTVNLLGDEVSEAGKRYSEISMYDLRHIACCYWLPRYKSESALKYRFGWKKSDKIHYYSEFLGMRDTIAEEDLLVDVTKTELEQRMIKLERENQLLKDKLDNIEKALLVIDKLTVEIEKQVA
tara:strand:+ start:16536 stop:17693 length:1158 start_codon:yes stop_codon:yes gene_type:complete